MTVRRLFVWLFVVALFSMGVRETLDPDLWWHLKTGEYILANGIPKQDVFSYTVPNHPWITHEWLSEVIMWQIFQVGQLPGLILFFAGLTALTYWLVYLSCRGQPYLAAFVTLLAAITSAIVWGARPQMFNLLLTAVFVLIVHHYKKQPSRKRLLWWLVPLTAVWANLHSGYLLGVVLLACYVGGAAIDRLAQSKNENLLTWEQIRYLAIMTGLGFLAAALNPNSIELWIYPFFTLGSGAMQAYIQEWHSPNFHVAIFWPFAAMIALGVTSWIMSDTKPSWTDGLLFLGTSAAGFLSARHIPFFAIVSAPILAKYFWQRASTHNIDHLLNSSGQKEQNRLLTFLNYLVFGSACLAAFFWTNEKISVNEQAIADQFPVAAVDYLTAQGLADMPGYNSYNWGGYLIWRQIPVFVDGRADVYGDAFLTFYRQAFDAQRNWAEPLEEFNVAYVLMENGSPLNTVLEASPEWEHVYHDHLAHIYLRKGAVP